MSTVDLEAKIPNNVGLRDNKRLLMALERWQPKFLEWWANLGPSDFNQDQIGDLFDLSIMDTVFFSEDPDADLNGDGQVDFFDLSMLDELFGLPPGPTGIEQDFGDDQALGALLRSLLADEPLASTAPADQAPVVEAIAAETSAPTGAAAAVAASAAVASALASALDWGYSMNILMGPPQPMLPRLPHPPSPGDSPHPDVPYPSPDQPHWLDWALPRVPLIVDHPASFGIGHAATMDDYSAAQMIQ